MGQYSTPYFFFAHTQRLQTGLDVAPTDGAPVSDDGAGVGIEAEPLEPSPPAAAPLPPPPPVVDAFGTKELPAQS